ncbi:PREDICTED: MMS19 nucleotide excision repair protein homolog [Acropora digitifera]|uniref:MMS19 nucleotide excision repair protein homolog n=1 Tax=Acropora digitifera TaxID=70779 RepID=UPI00077A3EC7|nr:PREDICTED: MMS19 nucleotide excision repair protein homolog [Acropora digitifera]
MLVFDLVRVIVRNFSIDLFVEDLFEVTSCYFPIDFTPPSDDPYGIKKEDLVARLRNCLAATNQFAPFCLPLLMEKLSSDIIDAKIDSLLTLSACLDVYHSTYVLEHVMPLWRDIKRVVFYSSSTELEEASLLALTSIVRNLSDSIEENVQEKYEELLETVLKDCNHLTGSNDVKLIKSCGRILHAVALSTGIFCSFLDSIQRDKSSAVYFKRSVVPTLLRVALQSALKESSECFISKESLQKLAAILRNVTCSLDVEEARDLLNNFVTLYVDGNSSFLDKTFQGTFLPLELTSPWRQTQLISLLTTTLCSARREVTIPRQTELVPRLQYLACHCDHERSAESGAQCLAGIINKAPEGDELTSTLNELSSRIWQNSDKEGSRKRATKTWLWLTKAVVIRSHALAPKFIEMVLGLMKDREVGRLAADGFYIIVADFDEVMNVKMHANCRVSLSWT